MSTSAAQTATQVDIGETDEFYSALQTIPRGLDMDQSTTLNARLVLLLANEVGDIERVKTIMQLAKTIEQG